MSGTAVPKWDIACPKMGWDKRFPLYYPPLSQSQSARGVGQGGVRWSPLPCPTPWSWNRDLPFPAKPPKRNPTLKPPSAHTLGDTRPPLWADSDRRGGRGAFGGFSKAYIYLAALATPLVLWCALLLGGGGDTSESTPWDNDPHRASR